MIISENFAQALDKFYDALDKANLESLSDIQDKAYWKICDLCEDLENDKDVDSNEFVKLCGVVSPRLKVAAERLIDEC